jgi:orotate phosphoribosyltransferase-like protein
MSLKNSGVFQKDIAKQFNVSRSLVEHIWLGKRWQW